MSLVIFSRRRWLRDDFAVVTVEIVSLLAAVDDSVRELVGDSTDGALKASSVFFTRTLEEAKTTSVAFASPLA